MDNQCICKILISMVIVDTPSQSNSSKKHWWKIKLLRNKFCDIFDIMAKREYINKRVITFKHTDSPLTSKRVSIILSNPTDSAKLAKAVRALRHRGNAFFKVSEETNKKIEEAKLEL